MKHLTPKSAWEEFYILFNFTNDLAAEDFTAEDIASVEVTAVDSDGDDATSTIIDATNQVTDGCKAYVWLQAGISGESYTITCRVTGESGSKFQYTATLLIL